jgi:hypothetical protein
VKPTVELSELINDHLGRGNKLDAAMAAVVSGLHDISVAFIEAQDQSGNWGRLLANLRAGTEQVRYGLDTLAGERGFEGFVGFAERQRAFASTMIDEVVRLQAGEATLVRDEE